MNNVIEFIIDSVDNNPNDMSLGEEIRAMKETIGLGYLLTGEPLYELLYALIDLTPNDYVLGGKIRLIKEKLQEYND